MTELSLALFGGTHIVWMYVHYYHGVFFLQEESVFDLCTLLIWVACFLRSRPEDSPTRKLVYKLMHGLCIALSVFSMKMLYDTLLLRTEHHLIFPYMYGIYIANVVTRLLMAYAHAKHIFSAEKPKTQ